MMNMSKKNGKIAMINKSEELVSQLIKLMIND